MLLPQEILKYYVILQRLLLGPSAETEPDDRSDGAWKLKKSVHTNYMISKGEKDGVLTMGLEYYH